MGLIAFNASDSVDVLSLLFLFVTKTFSARRAVNFPITLSAASTVSYGRSRGFKYATVTFGK